MHGAFLSLQIQPNGNLLILKKIVGTGFYFVFFIYIFILLFFFFFYYLAKWTAFRQSEGSLNSYGKFTVYNESHLFWEQIQNGDILDSIWVVKEQHTTNNVSKEFKQKIIDKVMEQFPEMTTNSDLSNFGPSEDDLADDAYLHLIVIALSIGGALALIFIMAYIVIRNHRKKGVTVKHWNDNVYVKKSFYRNIKNLENELMCDDLDVSDGTLPTSKLLSEHSEI